MDIKEFAEQIKKKKAELVDLYERKMPVFVGRIAKDHYQDNFRKQGFVNDGLQKWQPSQRLSSGGSSAGDNYGTLLSGRNHLFSSVNYTPQNARVRVYNDAPHAPTHNFGGTLKPTVTPRMRRFAWAQYYRVSGKGKNAGKRRKTSENVVQQEESTEALNWKKLALTKKTHLSIKIPARPFLGESKELDEKISEKAETEIRKILNK
ncbi:MAG: phage virion morphogenesis protein [Tannerellaceae bacterium]|nr:phage virion morphogenesis protein [Tannerellaceae bacterium]